MPQSPFRMASSSSTRVRKRTEMSDTLDSIVIVGAGQAGGWCAKSLRKEGFSGTITLIGDENHLPYERPPLSKSVLSGADEPDICLLYSDSAIEELQLNFSGKRSGSGDQPPRAIDSTALRKQRRLRQAHTGNGRKSTYPLRSSGGSSARYSHD